MEIIFLGTGTSQGVPPLATPNIEADLNNPKNWRTRSSIHVVLGEHHIQVDATPDFRTQCLRESINWIDTFILTHSHADHILGMDDMRSFCSLLGGVAMPVYSTEESLQRVREISPYAIREKPEYKGYPAFALRTMPEAPKIFEVPGGRILATRLPHGSMESLGLIFEESSSGKRAAYFCDCKRLTPTAYKLAHEVDLLIIDGLRPSPHPTHLSIPEAVQAAQELGAKQTYLTHLTHFVDHDKVSTELPPNIKLSYDGLRVSL